MITVVKKYNEQGLTTTSSRSGRPKILSECNNRQLIKIAKVNRSSTFEELTEKFNTSMAISVSSRTVQRALHKESYSGHAAKKNLLFQKKIEKNNMDGVVCEKTELLNGII